MEVTIKIQFTINGKFMQWGPGVRVLLQDLHGCYMLKVATFH